MLQSRRARYALLAACLLMIPTTALAQEGTIAGTIRDEQGAVLPGVTVEATSPALIRVRTTVSDDLGQYRITNLPIGTYTVVFTLSGFQRQQRDNVVLTSGFTANVSPALGVGNFQETVAVRAESPVVDVQNARQAITFSGDQLQELPTSRNIVSLLATYAGNRLLLSARHGVWHLQRRRRDVLRPGRSGLRPGRRAGRLTPDLAGPGQGRRNGPQFQREPDAERGRRADRRHARRVHGRHRERPGDLHPALGCARRVGNRRRHDQHRAANRGEPLRRKLQHDLHQERVVREERPGLRELNVSQPGPVQLRRVGRLRRSDPRDRLWFYSVVRDQGKEQVPGGGEFFPNLHYGKWGYNYQPDRPAGVLAYTNRWQNVNGRFTWQATQRNKFNIFWDEQNFCQDPCHGMVATFVAPEAWWSVQVKPNRLQQFSWTNPFTNRILLEAGASITVQDNHTDKHLEWRNPREIPRVSEIGTTAGGDAVAPRVNTTAGGALRRSRRGRSTRT